MIKKEKIGVLLYSKKLDASKREIITAAKIINKGKYRVSLFGKSKSKVRAVAKNAGLEYIKLGKIAGRQDFNAALKFTRKLKDEGVSTILFRDHRSTNLLVTAKYLLKGKLRLIFFQDKHLSQMKPDFLHTFRFNQIDAWITPMNQTANSVRGSTNLALDKIHVMPLPIPRKPFQFDAEERSLRKSILFGDSKITVVGWNVPQDLELQQRTSRRLLELLRIDKRVNVCLNLRDLKLSEFFALIPEMQAFKDVIKATPFDPHDADMYAHLDALFIDPELEPFSGITNRALMSGVLPVAPKSLVTDELLENGETGIIYSDTDDATKISSALEPSLLDSFRADISGGMEENYRKKRFRENLETLIRDLPRKARAR